MLLSLRSSLQTQRYIYKRVMVCAQAVAITWSKFVPDGSCQANFRRWLIMPLHWYACISTNTYCFEMHHIPLEMDWWALSNTSSIAWIQSAVLEILADKAFTAIDGLISQSFVVAFIHPTYVQIALIWGFPVQLSLWKSVHWLWRYKLNEVCDIEWLTIAEFAVNSKTHTVTKVLSLMSNYEKESKIDIDI